MIKFTISLKCFSCLLLGMLTLGSGAVSGGEVDLTKPSSNLRRFVSDVVFVAKAGNREKYSKRLPKITTFNVHGNPESKKLVSKHLSEIAIAAGVELREVSVNENAIIEFYFGPEAELTKQAKDINVAIDLRFGSAYRVWFDANRVANQGVVFFATDMLEGPALEDRLIVMILGVFGLPSNSDEVAPSCLSEDEEEVFTKLQPVDRAVLEFYYRAVPAGTKPRELDKIFREQWVR